MGTLAAMATQPAMPKVMPQQRPALPLVFRDKKEAMEALKELLRDKNVPSSAAWETALKMICKDARWETLSKLTEKKTGLQCVQDPEAKGGERGREIAGY